LKATLAAECDKTKNLTREIGLAEREKTRLELEKAEFKRALEGLEGKRATER
jgi:hypothetical protein